MLDICRDREGRSFSPLPAPEPASAAPAAPDFKSAALAHKEALLRRAMWLTRERSEAQDLVHDTFERLLRNCDRLRPDTNVVVWMHTVMYHLFLDRCRRKTHGPDFVPDGGEAIPAPEPSEPPPRWARVTQDQFAAAVDGLPADFRIVFDLHAIKGMPYDQIARELGIAVNTVGSRLYRARSLLKRALVEALDAGEEGT